MNILSLDLSTQSTGWAAWSDGSLKAHGCIVKKSKDVIERIIWMQNQIISLIKIYNIDKIIMEEVRPDYNNHTGKVLVWLQAAVVIAAHEIDSKIQYDFIGASEWRAALSMKQGRGIKRDQLKLQDIKYIKDNYNIEVNDDEADAICIYEGYYIKKNNEINWE